MKRGDIVTVALPEDYGKPRPALIVQSDLLDAEHPSVALLPITSHLVPATYLRVDIGTEGGLLSRDSCPDQRMARGVQDASQPA